VSNTCRRRRWTAEQKRRIVAESMEPGASAAIVARRHGINGGQVYAWRQQLLLRGAFAAGVDTTSSLVGADVTTTAQRLKIFRRGRDRRRFRGVSAVSSRS
jgi:transposase